jgi:transcription initiation factor TFIIIB Brf1 subunit/transcription initiation factor TFIIB
MDWYLNLNPHAIRGYKVEIKFKTILYLLLKLKYGRAVLYDEFKIEIPGRHTQLLKSKLLQEYARIYTKQLGADTERLSPKDYIFRFNSKYPFTQDQKREIGNLYNKTHPYLKMNNKSPDPRTYAGALIYMATRGQVTQVTIATEFGITPNGLRNLQRQIKAIIGV